MGTKVNELSCTGDFIIIKRNKDDNKNNVDLANLKKKVELNQLKYKLLKGNADSAAIEKYYEIKEILNIEEELKKGKEKLEQTLEESKDKEKTNKNFKEFLM